MFLFFFNDTATTEIYTLSLHDALPISSFFLSSFPHFSFSFFLVACTRLYKPLCRSVGRSVGLSVGLSVGPSLNARSTRLMAIGLVISQANVCARARKGEGRKTKGGLICLVFFSWREFHLKSAKKDEFLLA